MNANALGRQSYTLTPTPVDNGEYNTDHDHDHDSEAAVHASYASVSWSIRSYICLQVLGRCMRWKSRNWDAWEERPHAR